MQDREVVDYVWRPSRQPAPTPSSVYSLRALVMMAALVLGVFLIGASGLRADDMKKEEEGQVAYNQVTGRLAMVNKRAVSVEYDDKDGNAFEMLLPINDETQLAHVRSLEELRLQDTVRVQYKQTYRDTDTGERMILKTVATNIDLVRSATKQMSSREAAP